MLKKVFGKNIQGVKELRELVDVDDLIHRISQ
jgi:hypothetical protein